MFIMFVSLKFQLFILSDIQIMFQSYKTTHNKHKYISKLQMFNKIEISNLQIFKMSIFQKQHKETKKNDKKNKSKTHTTHS